MGPDGALSSDEVNFLIYRYLLEAGELAVRDIGPLHFCQVKQFAHLSLLLFQIQASVTQLSHSDVKAQ